MDNYRYFSSLQYQIINLYTYIKNQLVDIIHNNINPVFNKCYM
jgi:hypothetical protein